MTIQNHDCDKKVLLKMYTTNLISYYLQDINMHKNFQRNFLSKIYLKYLHFVQQICILQDINIQITDLFTLTICKHVVHIVEFFIKHIVIPTVKLNMIQSFLSLIKKDIVEIYHVVCILINIDVQNTPHTLKFPMSNLIRNSCW